MADEEKKQKENTTDSPKKSNKKMMIAGVAAASVFWGVVFFAITKMVSQGPADAIGSEIAHQEMTDTADEQIKEILIANNFECPHTNTGRLYVIRMTVYATVPKSLLEVKGEKELSGIEEEIQKRIATIKDRMRTVIAGADPSTLCLARSEKPDYGLSTLRRQFKTILDDVLGKGKVKDVLISDYMPTPLD